MTDDGYRSRPLRLRPGERPAWLEVPPSAVDPEAWRERARRRRLGTDAWLALIVEHQLAWAVLDRCGGIGAAEVFELAKETVDTPRLPPNDDLRLWEATLLGSAPGDPPEDELPVLCLPARLVHRLGHRWAWTDIPDVEDEAVLCDRAAAREGKTMEAFILESALRVATGARSGETARVSRDRQHERGEPARPARLVAPAQ